MACEMEDEDCALDVLVGKTIKGIKLNKKQHAYKIAFITEEKIYVFECTEECCSDTWIESIESTAATEDIIGQKVLSVNQKYMGEMEEEYKKDGDLAGYTKLYCVDIITAKGTLTIDFRNNSNGYYGGGLSLRDEESDTALLGWNPWDPR